MLEKTVCFSETDNGEGNQLLNIFEIYYCVLRRPSYHSSSFPKLGVHSLPFLTQIQFSPFKTYIYRKRIQNIKKEAYNYPIIKEVQIKTELYILADGSGNVPKMAASFLQNYNRIRC